MTQKRIAIISYHTCPLASKEGKETGGMNIYVLHTAKELAQQGFLVDIFTRSQDIKQPHIVMIRDGLRVIHLKAGPENYILPDTEENKQNFFDYIPEFVKNFQLFQKNENITYDIFDAHYYLSGLVALELKNQTPNTPLLMTFHTLGLMKNLIARNGLTFQDKKRIVAEMKLVTASQGIITPSQNEKEYVEYLYNAPADKIQVVSPGVDTSLFRQIDKKLAKQKVGASLDHKMILFVGRIDPVKGVDVLLYAMKILVAQHSDMKVCLWIVGGDLSQSKEQWSDELQKLEKIRKLFNLDSTVKFINQQSQNALVDYYNAADLLVMPSHYESFGMTALEAMSCGTPVITTNVTGISELIDEFCQKHITTANNPLLLAKSIFSVLSHHSNKEFIKNMKEYDWKYVAEKISKIYKEFFTD